MENGTATFHFEIEGPSPRVLTEFSRLDHGLRSGKVTILDHKTIRIPNLHYDGKAPAATFWVGNGSAPHRGGQKIPNEFNRCSNFGVSIALNKFYTLNKSVDREENWNY
jgi:hypothetical protein